MKITICGSMKLSTVMRGMGSWLLTHGVKSVTLPKDIRPKSVGDKEFASSLIKRRAIHLASVRDSDLVIVVCEKYTDFPGARIIFPESGGGAVMGLENSIRSLPEYEPVMESWTVGVTKDENITDIYGCTLGYDIGESTSFEMLTALNNFVPVLIVPAKAEQNAISKDNMYVNQGNSYVCLRI